MARRSRSRDSRYRANVVGFFDNQKIAYACLVQLNRHANAAEAAANNDGAEDGVGVIFLMHCFLLLLPLILALV